jgi:hypothetical protein
MPESPRTHHRGRGRAWKVTGGDPGRILGKPSAPKPTAEPSAPWPVSSQPARKARTKQERQRALAAEVRAAHQVDLVLVEPSVWQATCRCGRWQARIPARKGGHRRRCASTRRPRSRPSRPAASGKGKADRSPGHLPVHGPRRWIEVPRVGGCRSCGPATRPRTRQSTRWRRSAPPPGTCSPSARSPGRRILSAPEPFRGYGGDLPAGVCGPLRGLLAPHSGRIPSPTRQPPGGKPNPGGLPCAGTTREPTEDMGAGAVSATVDLEQVR